MSTAIAARATSDSARRTSPSSKRGSAPSLSCAATTPIAPSAHGRAARRAPDVIPSSRATRWSTSGSSTTASTRSVRPRSSTRPTFVAPSSSSHADERRRSPAAAATRSVPGCSGSAISTSRASISSWRRRATSASSGSSSTSDASALPISFRDSSCRSHRVDDSYSRAFSIATAACAARSWVSSSSSSVKSAPPSFSVR